MDASGALHTSAGDLGDETDNVTKDEYLCKPSRAYGAGGYCREAGDDSTEGHVDCGREKDWGR